MKLSVNTLAPQVMALLLGLLLIPSGQADNPLPYAETPAITNHHLEQRADASPVIAIHFDHCIDTPQAREKRVAKGILVSRHRILAPADYFIDPCSPPIQLPDSAQQTSARYHCHDQRIKTITHLSLIPEATDAFMPNNQTESDAAEQQPKPPGIIRVLNELNFNGSSTIDAVLCHTVNHGSISPEPAVAVVSLSNRGKKAIPPEITVAKTDLPIGEQQDASTLLFTNQTHFYQSGTSLEDIRSLIAATGKDQQHNQNTHEPTAEPFALLSQINEQHYLRALVNNGELIEELPSPSDLPDYAERHPYSSVVWKLSSPFTGTISHALGMKSIPGTTGMATGVLAATELVGLAMGLYFICNSLAHCTPLYPILQVGLGLTLLNGFYRWTNSEY